MSDNDIYRFETIETRFNYPGRVSTTLTDMTFEDLFKAYSQIDKSYLPLPIAFQKDIDYHPISEVFAGMRAFITRIWNGVDDDIAISFFLGGSFKSLNEQFTQSICEDRNLYRIFTFERHDIIGDWLSLLDFTFDVNDNEEWSIVSTIFNED